MRKLLFVAVMLPALASGAVYKCVDASGKTTFSDRACAGTEGGVKVDVKLASGAGEPVAQREFMSPEQRRISEKYKRTADLLREPRRNRVRQDSSTDSGPCKTFSDTDIRTMIIKNQVVEGMRASDASRAWGTPWRVNGNQHAYHWERGSAYFYTEDGCVRSVQGGYVGGKFVK
ncbi:MAG: DUF4124 domain-containing protein [Pseudomonas sp.]|nr:DUF4124 domain-containing protein [Pseudomonas sp.]